MSSEQLGQEKPPDRPTRLTPATIAVFYMVMGGLWILFSDRAVEALVQEPGLLTMVQTFKGWLYVLVTAGFLYILLRIHFRAVNHYLANLEDQRRALSESEIRFKVLVEQAPDAIYLADGQGRILDANPAACEILGYSHEELRNLSVSDVDAHYDSPESIREFLEAHTPGRPIIMETLHRRMNGETFPVELHITSFQQGGKERIMGLARDVTERKRVEEVLRESEEKYRLLAESTAAILWEFDIPGDRWTFVAPQAENILGYAPEEWTNFQFWADHIHEGDREWVVKYCLDRTALGEPHDFEYRFVDKFGKSVWLRDVVNVEIRDGAPFKLRGFMVDVTKRKRAEDALRESEERFRSIVEGAPEPIFIQTDHKFAYLNPKAYTLFGAKDPSELIGKPVMDRFHPENHDAIHERIRLLNEARQPVHNLFEQKFIRLDGSEVWVETLGQPIVYQGKNGALVFVRDISERKEMEKQLAQAQKMEAIGTLAGGVSHDFNNLLQAIIGYTQVLLFEKTKTDPEYPNLIAIQDAGNRAADLVRRLLLFSRKVEKERKPIRLEKVIEQACGILERTIPKMVEIEIHMPSLLWAVNADPVQMEQIVLNLGTNAADAMSDGGKLVIEAENIVLNRHETGNHLGLNPGRYVQLKFSDTGHGMDNETMKKIFEPFFTTKEIGKGTGLGLASVYGIVKNHGGSISCTSEVSLGTSYKILLPANERANAVEKAESEANQPFGGTETILLVDDEESIRDFASKVLKKFGYTVVTAASGEDALDVYSSKSDGIDLVIMDIGMPGMGGSKCLREILQRSPAAKVLIASGYAYNEQVAKTLESGAAGYVVKPYQLKELLAKVRGVLDELKKGQI